MTSSLVSVCVPAYNYARFLPDCIESVLAQTLADWDLVIVDDASTDDTHDVALEYARRDTRIRYVRNDRRVGMIRNLRRAADQATAPYIKMLCADDWIAPRCLEVMTGLMERHPTAVLATAAEIHTDAAGTPLRVQFLFGVPVALRSGDAMLARMARGRGFGGNSSFLIRASAYRAVGGYDAGVRWAGDYDLAARLCRVGDYVHTDEPLFYGREHPEASSSRDSRNFIFEADWFEIPDRCFRARRIGDRNWRRYHRLIALQTARYLLNAALDFMRGYRRYARALVAVVIAHGNLWVGLPYLVGHLPARALRRLTGRHRPASRPPEPWMGRPV